MSRLYETSPIKRRRASKPEMEQRLQALFQIVSAMQPMTVRQAFYQATVRGIIDKTEAGYGKVQRALVDMRRSGQIPYDWIADNTRWQRKPTTYRDPSEAVRREDRQWPVLSVYLFPVEQREQSLLVGGETCPRLAQVNLSVPLGGGRVWRGLTNS